MIHIYIYIIMTKIYGWVWNLNPYEPITISKVSLAPYWQNCLSSVTLLCKASMFWQDWRAMLFPNKKHQKQYFQCIWNTDEYGTSKVVYHNLAYQSKHSWGYTQQYPSSVAKCRQFPAAAQQQPAHLITEVQSRQVRGHRLATVDSATTDPLWS